MCGRRRILLHGSNSTNTLSHFTSKDLKAIISKNSGVTISNKLSSYLHDNFMISKKGVCPLVPLNWHLSSSLKIRKKGLSMLRLFSLSRYEDIHVNDEEVYVVADA